MNINTSVQMCLAEYQCSVTKRYILLVGKILIKVVLTEKMIFLWINKIFAFLCISLTEITANSDICCHKSEQQFVLFFTWTFQDTDFSSWPDLNISCTVSRHGVLQSEAELTNVYSFALCIYLRLFFVCTRGNIIHNGVQNRVSSSPAP